jgi:hypothetical protein
VIARALAKSPDARYQSAGDLGRAAVAAAAGEAVEVRERLVAVGAAAPVEVDTRTAASPAPPGLAASESPRSDTKRSRRAMVRGIGTTLIVLALGAVVGYMVKSDGDGATTARTATPDAATPSAAGSAMQVLPIRIGGRLNALAVSHDRVWTGEFRGPRLQAVEASTSRRLTDLRPEVGVGIEGLAVSGRTLWAIASRDHRLSRLDVRTGEPIGKPFPLPSTSSANAVVAGRDSVWVATTTPEEDPGDQILNLDPATGRIREMIEVGDGVRRMVLARGGLWVLRSQPARLTRIDLRTRKRRTFQFEGEASGDLALGAGALWVTLSDTNQVARVKLGPRTRNPQPIAVGQHPVGVVVHDGSVWVANRDSSTLSRVDARAMRVRGEVEVPLNPYEIGTDGEALWVTSLALGRLTRVGPP